MIRKSNMEKVLGVFFTEPTLPHQLRGISKRTGIGLPSVKRYVESLAKAGLVMKKNGQVFPYFAANRESREFRLLKTANTIRDLEESGLLEALESSYPDCIVLFGSAARGEDTEKSDIDIFLQVGKEITDFARFEKSLGRRLNVLFEKDAGKLQKELRNNLANGIVLSGFLKVG